MTRLIVPGWRASAAIPLVEQMSTVASVLDTVRSSGLLEPARPATSSGGADSVCLVHSLDQALGLEA